MSEFQKRRYRGQKLTCTDTISKTSFNVSAIYGAMKARVVTLLVGIIVFNILGFYSNQITGAIPPLVSVTIVRVINFSTYSSAKHSVSRFFERITGESPLARFNQPGSSPTLTSILTFTLAGFCAGGITSPLACKFLHIPLD